MHEAITALLDHGDGPGPDGWRSLWDRLEDGALDRAEVAVLLTALAVRLPDGRTLRDLVASLRERAPAVTGSWPGSVNIVGSGGGPGTFNISTAAAFVAAAMGVPVVKTGSRAYTSVAGSVDLLDRLGIGLTTSPAHTEDALERFGIAFAGQYVYPPVLTRLARSILPLSVRPFGRFFNTVGPFLPALPVTAQVTGVSRRVPLAGLRELARAVTDRTIWLCANDLGADELIGFADNTIYPNDGHEPIRLPSGTLTTGGTLDDLRPATDPGSLTAHFLDVVSGAGNETATQTVCLNAAALAVAGGHLLDWHEAMDAALDAVHSGAARALLDRVRAQRTGRTRSPAVAHG
ncbi:anthranilate phosphoribosyltransferase [Thermostaphylospora chromogena]|uniref:Anthranilate phosphoribosyltransferase n=1 Tax=Thermostaphylospora chromogena TaxID=35622 RepID=A0A1H1HAQ8_9ACTN|nr:hypothetical protein [Thermostaphylospora chromogena]SDR22461.1 anthranilate phosphoribosyltransferase [Thermostaphylospora chromogena]